MEEVWQVERSAVQLWVSIAALVLLLAVAPTLAWLVHAFLRFRARVEERLFALPSRPPPAPPPAAATVPALPLPFYEPEGPGALPDFFGPAAPRPSSPTPSPVPPPRTTRLPPRR